MRSALNQLRLLVCLAAWIALPAMAQDRGTIRGNVLDESGAVVLASADADTTHPTFGKITQPQGNTPPSLLSSTRARAKSMGNAFRRRNYSSAMPRRATPISMARETALNVIHLPAISKALAANIRHSF